MRDAFLLSGAIALVIYWLYPVAPPWALNALADRFDPNAPSYVTGFFDTMQAYLGYGYQAQSTRAFVNPYAAMPSLHFGWDLLLGIGIVWASWRRPWMWLALPIAMVALMGLPAALAMRRGAYPPLISALERSPWPSLRGWFPADTGDSGEVESEAGISGS